MPSGRLRAALLHLRGQGQGLRLLPLLLQQHALQGHEEGQRLQFVHPPDLPARPVQPGRLDLRRMRRRNIGEKLFISVEINLARKRMLPVVFSLSVAYYFSLGPLNDLVVSKGGLDHG